MRRTGSALLDMQPEQIAHAIADRLEAGRSDRIPNLSLSRVGPGHHAAVVSLVSDEPQPPATYKARLANIAGL